MSFHQSLRFFFVLSSIFCAVLACSYDELFVIRTAAFQGLVLDGANSEGITIQLYKNSSSQFWKFLPGDKPGMYYIVNNQTGKALDYHPGQDRLLNLVAKRKLDSPRQQWSLSLNGRITNVENRRNIDVKKGKFSPGTPVIVWQENGNEAQDLVVVSSKATDLVGVVEKPTNEVAARLKE